MRGRFAAILMAVLVGVYVVLAGQRAVLLLGSGDPVGVAMGVALIVLPVLAVWFIGREIAFGVRTQRLVRLLDADGGLPQDEMPSRASGRPLREAADAAFPHYREAVEADPGDWRAWFKLGLAYDASGDRRRARAALREAIRLERGDAPAAE